MNFAQYGRKSIYSDKSDSVDNQQRMCREYAEFKFKEQIDSFECYSDEGFTGANTDRPGLQRLLADIEDGLVDALIVYQLDRLSRDIRDFANIYYVLEQKNVKFISIKENIDTNTPIGKAMMMVSMIFAQMERETIAQRVTDNMLGLAKKGYWTGGALPCGYTSREIVANGKKHVVIEPTPEGIEYIHWVFDTFLENGYSMGGMVTVLRNQGIRTNGGKYFSQSHLYNLLTMPYCVENTQEVYDYYESLGCQMADSRDLWDGKHGVMAYNRTVKNVKGHSRQPKEKWVVCSGIHEPFMPAEKWLAVQAQMKRNTFNKKKKYENTLLKGIIRCAKCNRLMGLSRRMKKNGDIASSYICEKRHLEGKQACDMRSVQSHILDNEVMEIFRRIESDSDTISRYIGEKKPKNISILPKLTREERSIQAKITRLTETLAEIENSTAAKHIVKQIEQEDLNIEAVRRDIEIAKRNARQQNAQEKSRDEKVAEITKFMRNIESFTMDERNRIAKDIIKKCTWDGSTLFLRL